MHKEILSDKQLALLPLLGQFTREFYLAGGTAVALHIGHRRSIDFDLFKFSPLNHKKIIDKITAGGFSSEITHRSRDQINLIIAGVKMTFLEYPFRIEARVRLEQSLRLPVLEDLAAMKAFDLGRRSKWKDYADLYFIFRYHLRLRQVTDRASMIFGQFFSEKLFRAQLCYFEDIDYSEPLEYLGEEIPDEEIRNYLTQLATEI